MHLNQPSFFQGICEFSGVYSLVAGRFSPFALKNAFNWSKVLPFQPARLKAVMEHHLVMASGVPRVKLAENLEKKHGAIRSTKSGWQMVNGDAAMHKKSFGIDLWLKFEKKTSSYQIENQSMCYISPKSVPLLSPFFRTLPCRISQYSDVCFLKYLHGSSHFQVVFQCPHLHLLYQGTVWTASHSISYQPHHCPGAQQKLPSWLGSISAVMWISCGLVMTTQVISDLFM